MAIGQVQPANFAIVRQNWQHQVDRSEDGLKTNFSVEREDGRTVSTTKTLAYSDGALNKTTALTNGDGETRTRTLSIERNDDGLTRSRTVTNGDGETHAQTVSLTKTEDGFTKLTATVGPDGETTTTDRGLSDATPSGRSRSASRTTFPDSM